MTSVKVKRLEGIIRKDITDIIQFSLKDPNVGFVQLLMFVFLMIIVMRQYIVLS